MKFSPKSLIWLAGVLFFPLFSSEPVHFQLSINPTGESNLIVINSSIIGVSDEDEIGIFDMNGLISNYDCSSQTGELLTGSAVWHHEQLSISAIGSIDNCPLGGFQIPGYVSGNNITVKLWNFANDVEYPVYAVFSDGGVFGDLFSVIDDFRYYHEIWFGQEALQPMQITVTSAFVSGYQLSAGDEIAVYYDDVCVGSVKKYDESPDPLLMIAGADNPDTVDLDGFVQGGQMVFRIWDSSDAFEESWVSVQITGDEYFTIDGEAEVFIEGLKADDSPGENLQTTFMISSVYPNPFNPDLRVEYTVWQGAELELEIYSVLGICVYQRDLGFNHPGRYQFIWRPDHLPSGVYHIRLASGTMTQSIKAIFLK